MTREDLAVAEELVSITHRLDELRDRLFPRWPLIAFGLNRANIALTDVLVVWGRGLEPPPGASAPAPAKEAA